MAISPKVGQIYVGLTVDGSDVDKQIVDSVKGTDFDKLGEESAGEYDKAFNKRIGEVELEFKGTGPKAQKAGDAAGKNFTTRMARAIKSNKALESRVSSMLKSAIDSGDLEVMFQDLGRRSGHEFGKGLDDDFSRIVSRSLHKALLKAAQSGSGVDILGAILKSSKQGEVDLDFLGPAYQKIVVDLQRELGKIKAEMDAAAADAEVRGKKLTKKVQGGIEAGLADSEKTRKRISKKLAKLVDDGSLEPLYRQVGERLGINLGQGLDQEVESAVDKVIRKTVKKALKQAHDKGGKADLTAIFDIDVDAVSSQADAVVARITKARREAVEAAVASAAKAKADRDAADADTRARGTRLTQDIQKGIEGALGDSELTKRKVAQKLQKLIDDGSLKVLYRQVGEQLGVNLGSGIDQEVEDAIDKVIRKTVKKALKQAHDQGGKANLSAIFDIDVDAIADKARAATDKIIKKRETLAAAELRIEERLERDKAKLAEKAETSRQKALAKAEAERKKRGIFYRDDDTERTSGRAFGASVGRMFGRGSRNNILNLFGRSIGGLAGIMKTTTNAAQSLFKTFMDGASSLEEGASKMQRAGAGFSALGSRFATMAVSLPATLAAVAVAVVALSAAVTILVTVVSALIAVISSLIATVLSALVAALAVGSAAILAMVAASGLLVVAFTSMTEAQRKMLGMSFAPIKEQITGLGQEVLKGLVEPMNQGTTSVERSRNAFQVWADNISRALPQISPLARAMGTAFAEAGATLTKSFSGPGMQIFFRSLTKFLPTITTSLASALGGFLNGFGAMFGAMMPYVQRFSDYLNRTATKFSEWASSAKGQNSIKDFMDRASESLMVFWGLVKEVGGLMKDVFFSKEAQGAGNDMFKGMTNSIKDLRDFIKKAKKDGSFKDWIEDAKDFADALGRALKALTKLLAKMDSSATIKLMTGALNLAAKALGFLTGKIAPLLPAFQGLIGVIQAVKDAWNGLKSAFSSGLKIPSFKLPSLPSFPGFKPSSSGGSAAGGATAGVVSAAYKKPKKPVRVQTSLAAYTSLRLGAPPPSTPGALQSQGKAALDQTYKSHGGYMDDPKSGGGKGKGGKKAKKYRNPYRGMAANIIAGLPVVESDVRNAIREYGKDTKELMADVAKSTSGESVVESIGSNVLSMRDNAADLIRNKQDALRDAALSLQSAGSKAAAKRALQEVRSAQASLAAAQENQRRLNIATAMIQAHQTITEGSVLALVAGASASNATLAEIAEARGRIAEKISQATSDLKAAEDTLRDYAKSVADSTKSYASIIGVQARMIDGVQAALTSTDINQSVRDRLEKAKNFQLELRQLASMGLSNDAYKQLVDAGVEQGGETARALIAGGAGAVQELNDLMAQLDTVGKGIGSDSSTRLYQAGVDAAQGLLDGLKSQETALAAAAEQIAASLVAAVNRTLGIASPSRVMMESMKNVGDGLVLGLSAQMGKVSRAAESLSGMIAVSPEVAAHSAKMGESPYVSGNAPAKEFNLTVVTPTEDPYAVAMETMNEITGRL